VSAEVAELAGEVGVGGGQEEGKPSYSSHTAIPPISPSNNRYFCSKDHSTMVNMEGGGVKTNSHYTPHMGVLYIYIG
jgi:hypothetical protein